MKTKLTCFLLLAVACANAQVKDTARTHNGFHFEFGIGPSFGSIEAEAGEDPDETEAKFTGTGLALDVHAGHSIFNNFVATGNFFMKYIYSPRIEYNGLTGLVNADYTIREFGLGLGLTWYKTPADMYAGILVGSGGFNFKNNTEDSGPYEQDGGFTWQVRAGKHWWFSDKWGFTLGATYGCTTGTLTPKSNSATYDVESSRFSITLGVGLR